MNIIKKQFNNQYIYFNLTGDGMINATQMAQANGKFISDFFKLNTTEEYLNALSSDMGIPISQLYIQIKGNYSDSREQGTWVHKRLAIRIAQWCSPKFAVWIDGIIEELFTKGFIDFNIPKTFSEALKLASIQAEKIEQQEKQLIEQKSKVEYYNLVEESKSGLHIGEFAKLIKWKPRKLFEWLRNNGYLFYSNNENIPYQKYIDAGYFELSQKPDRLSKRIYSTTLITGKGQTYITGKLK